VSQYVRSIVVKRDFENDKVVMALKPVGFGDALKFKNIDVDKLNEDDIPAIFGDLKKYVTSLTGLRSESGEEVTVDELFSVFYFSTLLIDMLTEWVGKGSPKNPSSPGASQGESQPG
jgi:hypothetical protein